MDIKVHYDSSWGKVLGQNGLNAVKAHVQTYYCLPTLGSKIKLNVSIIF